MLYLIIYILAFIITLYVHYKRNRCYDVGAFILSFIIFLGFCSICLLMAGTNTMITDLSLFPFIYLYGMIMLTAYPFLRFNTMRVREIKKPNMLYYNIIVFFIISTTLMSLPSTLSNLSTGILNILLDSAVGEEMYGDASDLHDSAGKGGISNLQAIFSRAFYPLSILFFFYSLTFKHSEINRFIPPLMGVSVVVGALSSVAYGQRGGVIQDLLLIIATYFFLRRYIVPQIERVIRFIGGALILLVFVVVGSITIGRFGESESGAMGSVFYYAGQSPLFFNNYAFDNNGIRYGDRVIPLFKKIIGFSDVPDNFIERREKYSELKINDEVFSTFVGDFVLDFGPTIALIIFLVIFYNFYNRTRSRNGTIQFHKLILLHLLIATCIQGYMTLYAFADIAGNLCLIVYAVAYLLFLFNQPKNEKNIVCDCPNQESV